MHVDEVLFRLTALNMKPVKYHREYIENLKMLTCEEGSDLAMCVPQMLCRTGSACCDVTVRDSIDAKRYLPRGTHFLPATWYTTCHVAFLMRHVLHTGVQWGE